MRNRVSYLSGAPLILLCAGCGLVGGQSFDDGSGDLGNGRRDHVDGSGLGEVLSGRPTVRFMEFDREGDFYPFGGSVAFVGDLDADGYSDFVIDETYVFYGRPEFPEELSLLDADFTLNPEQSPPPEAIGDFNGDGFDDIAVALPAEHRAGLILGSATRRRGAFDMTTLETVLTWPDEEPYKYSAQSSAAGDVNGDGLSDLLVGFVATSRLVLGSNVVATATVDEGATIETGFAEAREWVEYSPPIDMDGDGMDDIVVIDSEGTSFYYGRADWDTASGTITRDALFQGWVQGLGDWDGDGYGDLVRVTERREYTMVPDPYYAGEQIPWVSNMSHDLLLSYGGPQRLSGMVELSRPPSDASYSSAPLGLGDTNGDGRLDLILGSPRNPMGGRADPGNWYPGGVFFLPGVESERGGVFSFEQELAALRGTRAEALGASVAANGDANGDGYQDMLIMRAATPDDLLRVTLIFGGEELR